MRVATFDNFGERNGFKSLNPVYSIILVTLDGSRIKVQTLSVHTDTLLFPINTSI